VDGQETLTPSGTVELCRPQPPAHRPHQGRSALRDIRTNAGQNADWHRLLEICALSETLVLDEDGLYDPCSFNDRMLLGMKGQLSEALWRYQDNASYGVIFTRSGGTVVT
jgi:hypothetical protein